MKHAIIDFESYYDDDTSVVNLGTPNYVRSADAYIVGVTIPGVLSQCGTLGEMDEICRNIADDPAIKPTAANSNFDQAWWEKYWPAFHKEWHCLLDHAAFHQYPRNLAGLAQACLGQRVDKTTRDVMKGVRYEDLPPAEQESVQHYCLNDCEKSLDCLERLTPMSAEETKIAEHTRRMNRRGIRIDTELVEADKTRIEMMRFEAFKRIPWHADAPPLSHQALSKYCIGRGIPVPKSLAKTDEECADLMVESVELAEVVGYMRRYRRANTMLRKMETLMDRVTPAGILALDLLYCGAPHTRRWSSKGFNVQNLDKEPLAVSDTETVWTRNWIVPRPGHKFLIVDYAQIEPRCLNWLAGNNAMLEAMRAGYSVYEAFAMQAEGWRGEPGSIKASLGKKRYTLLKNRVLGLGYGMGAARFEGYVRENGGEITTEEAKQIVEGFRKGNSAIVDLWKRLDNMIVSAGRDRDHHLNVVMPSGDSLQYFGVRGSSGAYQGYVTKCDLGRNSKQPRLWGGTLTENLTQRMARDVLASAIVRLEDAGLTVAFHVHDEVILEIPEAGAEEAKEEAFRIMIQPPEWAADLPLGVEGDFATAYTK